MNSMMTLPLRTKENQLRNCARVQSGRWPLPFHQQRTKCCREQCVQVFSHQRCPLNQIWMIPDVWPSAQKAAAVCWLPLLVSSAARDAPFVQSFLSLKVGTKGAVKVAAQAIQSAHQSQHRSPPSPRCLGTLPGGLGGPILLNVPQCWRVKVLTLAHVRAQRRAASCSALRRSRKLVSATTARALPRSHWMTPA